ncbi:Prophage PssSM-02, Orf6 [Pseudomonas savastanoi pv. nerii]|nr:Prophage PssSM-02, Orf6 [Pseudomonas savastanoi pv. nerii]KPY69875.1 Prophage PssSM-02, Orf6 [Pseudomonas savastanoi pv. savastanoi]RML77216.1 Prophage PssSM-02, Orf6 [Pseudomonas savastanoi pv. savastanoi]RMR67863.1 Prophage PssSM-02, Orf6 [Pseudomonas savastanoi pv. fraxini]RMT88981.1 Prophage PssSM-02, Orf6 [Pseudomonas savastanoi pv. nerii]
MKASIKMQPSGSGITMGCVFPSAIKCPKCDYKGHAQLTTKRRAYCPVCFDEFIRQHVPELIPDPEGKPFDPNSQFVYL